MLRGLLWSRSRPTSRKPALQLETLEDRTTPSVSPNDLFVATLYDGMLGRPADSAGLAFWSARLTLGNSTVAHQAVATGIATSNEALSRDVQIFFKQFLLRNPDPTGLAFWVGQLKTGTTFNQVRAGILGSDEFFGLVNSDKTQFLAAVYQLELGRPLDAAGQAFWTQKLNSGVSRQSVVQQILASTEGVNVKVTSFYSDLLGRTPDASGQAFWAAQFRAGVDDPAAAAGFVGGAEFVNKIQAFATTTALTSPQTAATTFNTANNLFTGPLPQAEQFARGVATSQTQPTIIANNDFYNVPAIVGLSVTSRSQGILANDVDPAGGTLMIAPPGTSPGGINTAKGTVLLRSDGTFIYTPQPSATGTDTFAYTASDANGVSNVATVTFNIIPKAPVANNDSYFVTENTPLVVNTAAQGILANDTDPAGLLIQVTSVGTFATSKGSITVNADGTFTYTPNFGATGRDIFQYTASDAFSVSNTATVSFTIGLPGFGDDVFEPNQTSDQATDFGQITTAAPFSLLNLTISSINTGLPDYDWYKWTPATSGAFTAALTTVTGGPLEIHLFTLRNNVLTELSNTATSGNTLSAAVAAGQVMFVEVKGQNTSLGVQASGIYDLNVSLS
jgi:hypothetical protein